MRMRFSGVALCFFIYRSKPPIKVFSSSIDALRSVFPEEFDEFSTGKKSPFYKGCNRHGKKNKRAKKLFANPSKACNWKRRFLS
jgi:hypothetical protein